MRIKLKKIRNLLAITLLIAFISCEKDNFSEESTTSKKGITVKEIKLNELFKDKRFKDLYNKLSPSSEFSKTSLEIENGFTIPDGNVKVIETDSVISYTMYIERDNQILLDKFENLVIQESKIDGLKLAYVLKYTPEEIKLAADNSFLFKGVIEKSNIISPLFNNVYSSSGGDCFIYVLMCDQGGKEHVAGGNCTISHMYVKAVEVLCPANEAPSTPNSGGDGSSTSGSDGTGTTSGGGSDGTGGSPNDDGGVLTTPVLGDFHFDGPKNDVDKTPCDDLIAKANQTVFNNKMAQLNSPASFALDHETGFIENRSNTNLVNYSNLTANPNTHTLTFPPSIKVAGYAHVHNDITIINGEDHVSVKMLSPKDLQTFATTCQTDAVSLGLTYSDTYGIMVSSEGTFALKMLSPTVDVSAIDFDKFRDEYTNKAKELEADDNLNSTNL